MQDQKVIWFSSDLFDIYITETQVSDIIKSFPYNNAAVPHDIGPNLIKEAGDAIIPHFSTLIFIGVMYSSFRMEEC